MADENPVMRHWMLLKMLSRSRLGLTIQEMAIETKVNEKTIRRDLDLFRTLGFMPQETIAAHGKKLYTMSASLRLVDNGFTWEEALGLYLAQRWLAPLQGSPIGEAARLALRKIRADLTPTARDYFSKLSDRLHQTMAGASDYSRHAEIIDQLLIGIRDSQVTFIGYRSATATEPVTHEVEPLGLVYHKGSLYLVAHSRSHEEIRHFKLDRVSEAEVQDFKFHRPEGFDLQAHLAGSFGVFNGRVPTEVVIRFSAHVARYVQEHRWHASQHVESLSDGSLRASFQLTATEEVKSWALSFGRHAEILAPLSLRESIQQELATALQAYQPAHPPSPTHERVETNHRPTSGIR